MRLREKMKLWIAGILLLPGCATVNFERDVRRASTLVEARSGLQAGWGAGKEEAPAWDGASPLTATQAATLALRNNRELRAELEQIAEARADLVQAGLLPNPIVSLAFRLPFQGGNPTFDADVVQQFTDIWLRPYRKGAAQAELDRVVLSASDRALRLVMRVRKTHTRIMYVQKGIELTQQDLALLQRSIDATEGRVRAGEASALDVNRVKQQLLGLQAELQRESGELDRLQRELLLAMGMADASTHWTAAEDVPQESDGMAQRSEGEILELVKGRRLDVAAARYEVEARKQILQAAARSVGVPGVDAGLSYEVEDTKGELGPAVGVSVPLFDTGAARAEKARASLRAAEARAEQAEQVATNEARTAFVDLRRAQALSDFYQTQVVVLAEGNRHRAEAAVRSGTADQTVLLEAQRELIEARRRLNQFQADASEGAETLAYAMGGWTSHPDDASAEQQDGVPR